MYIYIYFYIYIYIYIYINFVFYTKSFRRPLPKSFGVKRKLWFYINLSELFAAFSFIERAIIYTYIVHICIILFYMYIYIYISYLIYIYYIWYIYIIFDIYIYIYIYIYMYSEQTKLCMYSGIQKISRHGGFCCFIIINII